jgi:hypothetical protein
MRKYLLVSIGIVISLIVIAPKALAAIAFDASSTWTTGASVTNVTSSLTIGSGSNMILFALAFTTNNDASATYNGVPMTEVLTRTGTGSDIRTLSLFVLPAPAAGAHLLTISVPTSEAVVQGAGTSFSGAAQTTALDVTTSSENTGLSTSYTTSLTTITNNDWVVLGARAEAGSGALTGGASTTFRGKTGFAGLADTNAAVSPAGPVSMTVTDAGGLGGAYSVMAAFAPAPVPTTHLLRGSGITRNNPAR